MTTPLAEPSAPQRTSLWEDFVDTFYAPSRVFARRENDGFIWQIVIIAVLSAVLFFAARPIMQPIFDAEFARQTQKAMARNPSITAEQMEGSRAMMEKLQPLFVLVFVPIAITLIGLVGWGAGKLFDAKQTLRSAMMVSAYAFLPRLVEQILGIVQGFFVDPASLNSRYSLSIGVARFLDPDTSSKALMAVTGALDVFVIWQMILVAIGISVTGRIPLSRAAMAAAIVWLVSIVPGLLF